MLLCPVSNLSTYLTSRHHNITKNNGKKSFPSGQILMSEKKSLKITDFDIDINSDIIYTKT